MGLFGECDDCGEPALLRYKPHYPMDEQDRPSICDACRTDREIRAREHRESL